MCPFHANQMLTARCEKARVARPRRLFVQTLVRYRTKGVGSWHEGIVENLSHSGVLLRGPHQLSEATLVEIVLEMPEQISGQKSSMVLCQGRIIRRAEARESESPAMAASFLTTSSCTEFQQAPQTQRLSGFVRIHSRCRLLYRGA